MQQMVKDFELELEQSGSAEEVQLYREVRGFLDKNLGRQVDLEAVFSIVDSIIHWSPDRLGIASLYQARRAFAAQSAESEARLVPHTEAEVGLASRLRSRFEGFVQRKCEVPEQAVGEIEETYGALFDNIGQRVGGTNNAGGHNHRYADWPIFTTNYDAILEHYWIEHVRAHLNTGFGWNQIAKMDISNPDSFRNGGLRLFKLHGSLTWLRDSDYGLTEHRVVPRDMKKWTGSKFLGQVMLYPIEEKELYAEPYLTMFQHLNRELAQNRHWLALGYSFGDRFIRDIFVRNSSETNKLVILHPHPETIVPRLEGFKGAIKTVAARFGASDIRETTQAIIQAFTRN